VLEQNAFAFAAFSNESGDIPFIDLQVDSIQDYPAVKSLGNILKFYDRRIHRGTPYKANQSALWALESPIALVLLIDKSKVCFFGYGAKGLVGLDEHTGCGMSHPKGRCLSPQ